ncbi:MAG: rRNA maturation RNase YbeY [Alistipes sp.]|nr:rRNA maturation RNase YbeY [Alistipes sp.]
MDINYHCQECNYRLKEKRAIREWLREVAQCEGGYSVGEINYIFCPSSLHRQMNIEFVGHDYFTDIITFDYSELDEGYISGDIYIDYQTVADNARIYGTTAEQEMRRIVVHGVLHLCGQDDKTPETEAVMHSKEDKYLALFDAKFTQKR